MYLFFAGSLRLGTPAEAQILKRLKKGVKNAAERAVISKTEQKASRETGKAMDSILNPDTDRRTGTTGIPTQLLNRLRQSATKLSPAA